MGPKKQGFCSKINCIQMKLLYFENWHSARASKSAKIVLSKSIFYVKKHLNLSDLFFSFKNISLEEGFLLLSFFENFNFWTSLFSKMVPNFWGSVWTSVKVKLKDDFHFIDFFAKIYSLLTDFAKLHHWGHTIR